jgi:hypothetical protein
MEAAARRMIQVAFPQDLVACRAIAGPMVRTMLSAGSWT